MNMDKVDSPIEQLQQELADLRQQNEEFRRQATFSQLNPFPLFEFDRNHQLVYLNQAAQKILTRLGLVDARLFFPDNLDQTVFGKGDSALQSFTELKIHDQIFEETIVYSKDFDTIRIYANNITERRQAEQALNVKTLELAQTMEFLEAVTKGNDVIIATIDTNFCYTYFNQAYKEEVKHLSGKDICLGVSMLDTFTHLPEQQKVIAQEWSQVLHGETTNRIVEFGDPGLYRRVYNVLHAPIWAHDGNVVGAGEVAYNISEQVQAQQSLKESEARYHSLFQVMTEGFAIHEIILDENGKPCDYRFLDINPAFESLTGLKKELVVGKTYHEVLPGESDSWVDMCGKVILTGESIQFEEYSSVLKKHFEVFAYRCAPDQFAAIFLDITARKQMEDELRINLAKYSVLFDTLPLGVTITDQNGQIIEFNQEATRLLGLSGEQQKGKLIHGEEWKIVRPDHSPMPPEEYASVRALKEKRRIEDVEMGIIKDKAQINWISVTASPIPLKDYGVVITYNDISQRIQAEEALHQTYDRLELTVHQRTEELLNANDELRKEIIERKRIASELLIQTKAVEAERQRFNDVLELLPVYTILLTPDYHVSFTNRYFRERFGEDHGRRCFEYLFGFSEPCANCETFKVMETGTNRHWEWTGPDLRTYDVFDFPFKDVDGSALILELGIDITERKQAEEKLRLLNNYNRSLLEANLDALVTITADGKIGDVNTVTEAITGYSRQSLVGTAFHSYFTNPEKARLGYERVFETGTVRDYELEIQHRDGHTTPVVYNASIYHDETGNVAGVFAAARDIRERKVTERQLTVLNTALEAAANGIILVDKDGSILWSNPAFSRMTGYSKSEIVGQNPSILKSGMHEPEFYRELWENILAGKVWHGELVNRRKNGSFYYEEQIITPVIDQDGNITNFISIRQDITEHKLAEDALRKSEQQYRSLVIATAQIVWQTNAAGEVVEDSLSWRGFTGQSLEDFLGWGWINALHPDDRERVAEIWSHAVEAKSNYDVEYRIRNRQGEYNHFAVRGVPIKDNDGNISSWIGTCTDITEKKNYENQLIQAEKHAAIGRMVGSVTHEINNPLQTIKNCLFLIRQDVGADSISKEPLDMALSETQRLSNIVGQLRQLYRPQDVQTMHSQELLGIIEEVHQLITPHLNNSRVTWQPSPGLERCKIRCIRDQIIEVFLNITLNAVEAMQASGGILSLNMLHSSDGAQVGIIISDTGPGINPEILPHIFEPFITTKEFGLGLGLSICFGIIQKHGGKITVESLPGQGSSFTIWLPRLVE